MVSRPGSANWGRRTSRQRSVVAGGLVVFVVLGGIAMIGFATDTGNVEDPNYGVGWASLCLVGVIGLLAAVVAFVKPYVEQVAGTLQTALRPLPPPGHVTAELTRHLGRQPTPQEVQLVYAYLRDQKAAAQMDAALLASAIALSHYLGMHRR
jgi:hypothetical protein